MTYIDIQNWICKKLYENFTDAEIVVERNDEEIIKNSFYVSLRPLRSNNFSNVIQNKLVNVDIYYFNKSNTHLENLEMTDKLETIFKSVKVNKDVFTISDITSKEVEGVLIVSFTLDYYLETKELNNLKMGELNFKLN